MVESRPPYARLQYLDDSLFLVFLVRWTARLTVIIGLRMLAEWTKKRATSDVKGNLYYLVGTQPAAEKGETTSKSFARRIMACFQAVLRSKFSLVGSLFAFF